MLNSYQKASATAVLWWYQPKPVQRRIATLIIFAMKQQLNYSIVNKFDEIFKTHKGRLQH